MISKKWWDEIQMLEVDNILLQSDNTEESCKGGRQEKRGESFLKI